MGIDTKNMREFLKKLAENEFSADVIARSPEKIAAFIITIDGISKLTSEELFIVGMYIENLRYEARLKSTLQLFDGFASVLTDL